MQLSSPDTPWAVLPTAVSPRGVSRTAGILYLGIIFSGIIAEFVIRSSLIVLGDSFATATNIADSEQLFRFGIAADLIMLICDGILAVALYLLLAAVNRPVALLAMAFRLIHTAIVGASLHHLFTALDLANRATTQNRIDDGILSLLDAHSNGYVIGLIFFALHCLFLGYLLLRSHQAPNIFGLLILVASLGYLADGFAHVLMTDYASYADLFSVIVILPAVVGELSLAVWLLIRGFREGIAA